jgi:hypothetical protein
MADPADQNSVLDEVRNPTCTQAPKDAMCFKGQPCDVAPARWDHAVDQ